MPFLQNVFWLLVLIGIMVVIHELGHFWAAKLFKVHVEAFSIGFGPRLFGFRRGETDFKVCAIPFGGYVKMMGEQTAEAASVTTPEGTLHPDSFLAKPRWQRLIIAAAGPVMNILLAIALLTGLYTRQYPQVIGANGPTVVGFVQPNSAAAQADIREGDRIVQVDDAVNPNWEDVLIKEIASAGRAMAVEVERGGERLHKTVTPVLSEKQGVGEAGWHERSDVQVAGVVAGSAAQKAGLKGGDVLVSVKGEPLQSLVKLHDVVRRSGGKPVDVVYLRGGQRQSVTITPVYNEAEKRHLLGVQLQSPVRFVELPVGQAFSEAVRHNVRSAGLIFSYLRGLAERRMSPKSLEGPIRIGQLAGDAAREGTTSFVSLMAMVSLNLAVFNLLPIPILDGGVILLLLIEMVMRRDLSVPVKEKVIQVGFVFLMMVVAFVLYNDISKILPG